MNQEYIQFWVSVKEKVDEIERDYNNLSDDNKRRVDSIKESILRAHTYADAIQILLEQIK